MVGDQKLVIWKNVQKEIKVKGINFTSDSALNYILPDNMTDRDMISLLRILLLIAERD